MKHCSLFSRFALMGSLLMLIACQPTSAPLAPSPSISATSQRAAPPATGFRTNSLTEPFGLPFVTQSFQASTSITFNDGTKGVWSENITAKQLTLSRNESGSLLLDIGVGTWAGPDSFGLDFKLNFGNAVLEENTPLTAQVGSDSERTLSNYGTTVHHRFLTGTAVMVLRGDTLEVTIQGLSSGNQTWQECYNWGTGGVCVPREGSNPITSGSATFSAQVPASPAAIDVSVNPGTITGSGDGTPPEASVEIAVNKKTTPWQLNVTAPEGSSCAQPQQGGTDNTHLVFPFDASTLGNGTYKLKASYPSLPGVSDEETITVSLPVAVSPDKAAFKPFKGEQVTFNVQAPSCPQWTLLLQGTALTNDGTELTCTRNFTGTGNQPIVWDGKCENGAIAIGPWDAFLVSGVESAKTTVMAEYKNKERYKLVGFAGAEALTNDGGGAQTSRFVPFDDVTSDGEFTIQADDAYFYKTVPGRQSVIAHPKSRYHMQAFVDTSNKALPYRAYVTIHKIGGKKYFEGSFGYAPYVPSSKDFTWDLKDPDTGGLAPLGPYIAQLHLHHADGPIVDAVSFDVIGPRNILAGAYQITKKRNRQALPGVSFSAQALGKGSTATGFGGQCQTYTTDPKAETAYCLISGMPISRVRITAYYGTKLISREFGVGNASADIVILLEVDAAGNARLIARNEPIGSE